MDIKSLTYFVSAAKHLNFSKAAEECYVSRQALRQQIQNLETELQVVLFENNHNHLSLTLAGKILLENSKKLIQDFSDLQQKMKDLTSKKRDIRLAICSSMIPFQYDINEEDLKKFELDQDIKIIRSFMTLDECFHALQNNSVDCIYIFQLEDTDSPYLAYPIAKKEVYLDYCNKLHFHKETLDLEDILNYTFLGMGKIENTYPPLVKDLKENQYSLNYESVPEAIETFYKISKNEGVIFDLQIDKIKLPSISSTPFSRYQWFIGLLARKDYKHLELLIELCNFFKEKYPESL